MLKKLFIRAGLVGAAAAPMVSFADDATQAITSAQSTVIGIVAAGGAAMVAVALAGIGWGVGVKFIKKLRGAA